MLTICMGPEPNGDGCLPEVDSCTPLAVCMPPPEPALLPPPPHAKRRLRSSFSCCSALTISCSLRVCLQEAKWHNMAYKVRAYEGYGKTSSCAVHLD
jgi:hypothetical protein